MTGQKYNQPATGRSIVRTILTRIAQLIAILVGLYAFFYTSLLGFAGLPAVWMMLVVPLAIMFGVMFLFLAIIGRISKRGTLKQALAICGVITALITVAWVVLIGREGDYERNAQKPTPAGLALQQWQLSTGSNLGYFYLPAANPIDPNPILMLHGGPAGGTTSDLVALSQALAERGFDVYVFDQAGVGWSQKIAIEEYTMARAVADIEAIRVALGVEKVNLYGHSYGSALAAHYMAAHENNVGWSVLHAPAEYTRDDYYPTSDLDGSSTPNVDSSKITVCDIVAGTIVDNNDLSVAEAFRSQEESNAFFMRVIDFSGFGFDNTACKDVYSVPEDGPPDPLRTNSFNYLANIALGKSLKGPDVPDNRSDLNGIQTPTLIYRGECDYINWHVALDYRDRLSNSVLVVPPETYHGVPESDPRQSELLDMVVNLSGGNLSSIEGYAGDAHPMANR